jgi:histidinol-phosphate aminotransferase
MPISRRRLLCRLGVAAASASVTPSFGKLSQAGPLRPTSRSSPESHPIFLDHSENAYGPSEKVVSVLRDAAVITNRYARTQYETLVAKLAALHAVQPEQIILACGSSEILDLAAASFLGRGRRLLQAVPTCSLLAKFAQNYGAEVVEVRLNRMYEHDLHAMLACADNSIGLVYICNPNNPTGTLTPRKDIETFIRKVPRDTMVLIDEAYHHFVSPHLGYSSFLDPPFEDPRVVVCRTFSKVYGLAGLRIGYAVATAELASRLSASRRKFGISVISAMAAVAALDDAQSVRLAIQRNSDDRQEFANQVNVRMLRALDSHANFVMVNPMRSVEMVFQHLKKNNVLVAPAIPAMGDYMRISLGTPEDMQEFWHAWDQLPPTGKMAM